MQVLREMELCLLAWEAPAEEALRTCLFERWPERDQAWTTGPRFIMEDEHSIRVQVSCLNP